MKNFDVWKITEQSEEERNTKIVETLEQTNPPLAEALKRGLATAKKEKVVITPAMREGAKANEAFHKHRLQDE